MCCVASTGPPLPSSSRQQSNQLLVRRFDKPRVHVRTASGTERLERLGGTCVPQHLERLYGIVEAGVALVHLGAERAQDVGGSCTIRSTSGCTSR